MEFEREHILISDTFLGDLQIRYYGIIIVVALLVAAFVAAQLAKRSGKDPDHVWGGLTWAIIPGIVLARLWYVIFPPVSQLEGCGVDAVNAVCRDLNWMLENVTNLQNGPLAIWSGGLSIFGAVLGGFIGVYFYTRRNNLKLAQWLDIAGVAMPIGQAIGRIANYVNQELYGSPTNLPWGIQIDRANRANGYESLVEYPADSGFHPLYFYEALWSVLAFIVLRHWYLNHRERFLDGDFFLLYLIQYTFVRFILEFIRIEIAVIPGTLINSSQAMTGAIFVAAVVVFWLRQPRRREKQGDAPSGSVLQGA